MKSFVEFIKESINEATVVFPAWYEKGIQVFATQLENGLKNLSSEMKPYKAILEVYVKFFVENLPQAMAEDSYFKNTDNVWDFMHNDFYDNYIFDNDVADEELYEKFLNEMIWEKYYKSVTKKNWMIK